MCSFIFCHQVIKCLFLWSVVISFLIVSVVSIRCWQCTSNSDPKCADPFDNRTLPITDCDVVSLSHLTMEPLFPGGPQRSMKATMCRKIRQKVHGQWRTIRGCAFLGSPGEGTGNEHHCLIRQGTHDIYMEYCTCDSKDGCNESSRISPTLYLFITLPVFVHLIIHFSK